MTQGFGTHTERNWLLLISTIVGGHAEDTYVRGLQSRDIYGSNT